MEKKRRKKEMLDKNRAAGRPYKRKCMMKAFRKRKAQGIKLQSLEWECRYEKGSTSIKKTKQQQRSANFWVDFFFYFFFFFCLELNFDI